MHRVLRRRFMIVTAVLAWAIPGTGLAMAQETPGDKGMPGEFALPGNKFPSRVSGLDGKFIDVRKLAERWKVVVITLKATWCPVCQNQLLRIKKRLEDPASCGVTYLVLSPGPVSDLRAIQKRIGFPYPFIEDKNLSIAKSLGLQMSEAEIFPSIFILGPDLMVQWMQRGRGAQSYGDPALMETVDCAGLI